MKKKYLTIFLYIFSSAFALAQPVQPFLDLGAGPLATVEPGYLPAASLNASIRMGLAVGELWGARFSMGTNYTTSSTYTADWYRYRGFFGIEAALGPWVELLLPLPVDLSLSAGGVLARYDLSDSFFFFPFLEPSVSIPLVRISKLWGLSLSASAPVFLRADAVSAGLRFGGVLTLEPSESGSSEKGAIK